MKTTSHEDNLAGRQKDNITGRGPQRKTSSQKDDLTGKRFHRKMTLKKDLIIRTELGQAHGSRADPGP